MLRWLMLFGSGRSLIAQAKSPIAPMLPAQNNANTTRSRYVKIRRSVLRRPGPFFFEPPNGRSDRLPRRTWGVNTLIGGIGTNVRFHSLPGRFSGVRGGGR